MDKHCDKHESHQPHWWHSNNTNHNYWCNGRRIYTNPPAQEKD